MKLDGIDKSLVEAFENPEAAKKKKKRGIGGIFHKRKTSIPPKDKIKPNVDMKRFHWQTVDYKAAKNSIWKTMNEKNVTQNMNIKEFESLFSIQKKQNKLKTLLGGKDKKKEDEKKKNEEIKFVSAKRQYNVELLLKRLKLKGDELCKDIINMNEEKLNLDLLIKVSDMVPSDEEQMQAQGMSKNNDPATVKKYGIVEKFFYDLSSIWSLQERIKLWIFKKEFAEICGHQLDKINLLNKGLSDIQGSEALYEIFKIILAFGNYMNGGRRTGQAYGFSLETLRMLSGTKGTDQQTTLLMYIYKYCKTAKTDDNDDDDKKINNDKDKKGKGGGGGGGGIGANVVKELENVSSAVRIDIDSLDKRIKEVDGELSKLPKRLKEFEKHTKQVKNDVFVKEMNEWMKSAKILMDDLKKNFKEMDERAINLASTYAYKLQSGQVNEFLKIFDDFIKDWNKAKIKYTKLEEKKKKDALRAKKKEEAQKKLQLKLSKRTTTRKDLVKKNIFKDEKKVKQELALKEKLKSTMKAHVRKQTVMKQMFKDVLNQSDEEEEEETDDETDDDQQQQQYKQYISSYNNNNNNHNNQTSFNPDGAIERDISNVSDSTVVVNDYHQSQNSRDVPGLANIHNMDSNRSIINVSTYDASPIGNDNDNHNNNNDFDKSISMRDPKDFNVNKQNKPSLNSTKSTPNVNNNGSNNNNNNNKKKKKKKKKKRMIVSIIKHRMH